jgi:hydroxypyruvate reductase
MGEKMIRIAVEGGRREFTRRGLVDAALRMLESGLRAVDPGEAVRRSVRREGGTLWAGGREYRLEGGRVLLLAVGKAAGGMAAALEEILDGWIGGGLVTVPAGAAAPPLALPVREAGHPLPDEASRACAEEAARLLRGARSGDLVLVALSGGASALWSLPAEGLGLTDLRETTRLLLESGAAIEEINAVRKHLDLLKGGGVPLLAPSARFLGLILSDVVGDRLEVVASGPTMPDPSRFADAWRILQRRRILDRIPAAVRARLEAGLTGKLPETPKAGHPVFARGETLCVGGAQEAVRAILRSAQVQGFAAACLTSTLQGEASQAGLMLGNILREEALHGRPLPRPCALLAAGETTVPITGKGRGGRNLELALCGASRLVGLDGVLLASLASDGVDGSSGAGGAVVDGESWKSAEAAGLDPDGLLAENDSLAFFQAVGGLLRTGPTGTNVNDFSLLLAE